MITHIKDNDGKIIAYCEWRYVGPSGYETPAANHVWVQDIWVYPDCRFKNCLNRIIDEIMRIVPEAIDCYYTRGKYGERMRLIKRSQMERRRNAYERV